MLVHTFTEEERIQGGGGNAFDRLKRIVAAKAREALIEARQNLLPDIPVFIPANTFPGNGNITGSQAGVAKEEKPASRLAPLIVVSVLAGFILLRVFR